jgi:hypothetical protein
MNSSVPRELSHPPRTLRAVTEPSAKIDATAQSVRQLLADQEYGLEYYQRDYRWEQRQIEELLEDLTTRFLLNYRPEHDRRTVRNYSPYFLGSIVVSERKGTRYLIDGQQRLTTLTLLLIYLMHQAGPDQAAQVSPLISSSPYGQRRFNLYVKNRNECLQALYEGKPFNPERASIGARNLYARYQDIADLWPELFPSDVADDVMPYFIDWLMGKVMLVEILTSSEDMAYEIFETMNDRGLSLTPTELLKGYLVSRVDADRIPDVDRSWRTTIERLSEQGKAVDSDFFKAWLRGSYALTIRERGAGAGAKDFELIGTQFHRWVRSAHEQMGLRSDLDFERFVGQDLEVMVGNYLTILRVQAKLTAGLEEVRYNSVLGVPLQPALLLAPVTPADTPDTVQVKMRAVATYLDLAFADRFLQFKNYGFSPMHYNLFTQVIRKVRDQDPDQLVAGLQELLDDQIGPDSFYDAASNFSLNQRNRPQVKYLLARLAAYLDTECKRMQTPGFDGYMDSRFEIEHIWANHFERHLGDFASEEEFSRARNRIGDLLLLPKDFNASLNDDTYADKYGHYIKQNLLAQSLHEDAYKNDPNFLGFIDRFALPFRAYPDGFAKEAISERQHLYAQLCRKIWDPINLAAILN